VQVKVISLPNRSTVYNNTETLPYSPYYATSHHIITECWRQKKIPDCWCRGATVLLYKKGDPDDPSNFRPITLQPVWYKVFSSVYSVAMLKFLNENNYLDRKTQKGFWRGTDGVTEHSELLSHMLKDAKKRQRSIIVTLRDLKNAFGSVHHNLMELALRQHPCRRHGCFLDLFGFP